MSPVGQIASPGQPAPSRVIRLSIPGRLNFQLLLICLSCVAFRATASNHHVSTLYLIPSDYNFVQAEYNTIIEAMQEIQAWYQVATGGVTFTLEDNGVPTVIYLSQNAAYYSANYWGNILDELVTLGINNWEEGEIKMMFVRAGGGLAGAAQGCLGECGVGMIGMDLWPEFNSGQFITCPGGEGVAAWPCTPMGAIAHELGHALGLPHPDSQYPWGIASHSVMQTHWNYPYWHAPPAQSPWSFLTVERQHLRNNPFIGFVDTGIAQPYEEMPVCNEPPNGAVPTAGFAYDVDGLEVSFTNSSSGADLYYWTFGDGSVSTEEDPTYVFPEYGVYTVRLRASGPTSMMDMAELSIPVCNLATSISASEEEVCAGMMVTLSASGGSDYLWSNGMTGSSITIPVFDPDDYSVTISDPNGCYAVESIYIDALPSPDPFVFSDPENGIVCEGTSVVLQATGGSTYEWDTGDEGNTIVVTPDETTTYTVTVTNVFDCQVSAEITIEVNPVPVAAITVSQSHICPMDTVILTASGGAMYVWSDGSLTPQITVLPADTTDFTVTVSNPGGCSAQATASIIVYPSPNASISSPDSLVCHGDSIVLTGGGVGDFLWSTGDTLSIAHVQITRDTTFVLTVTSGEGCVDAASVSLAVYTLPDPVIMVSSDSVCAGEVVVLTGPAAASYLWTNGDTTQVSLQSFADTAIIGLTVLDTNQCAYPLTASVYVKPQSTFEVVGPSAVCHGDSIELVIQPAFPAYAWSTGCNAQHCVITSADTISVSILDTLGCTSSITKVIAGDDTYGVSLSGATSICEGEETVLSMPEGFVAYAWSTGADTSSIVVQESGVYAVTITGASGCQGIDSLQVEVQPLPVVSLVYDGATVSATGLDSLAAYTYQWNTGHTEPVITVDTAGQYCLTLTDAYGCSAAGCLDVVITRTEDISWPAIRAYPNPFDRHLFLEVDGVLAGKVTVFDLLNRPVQLSAVSYATGLQLDFGDLPSGVYIVAIPVGPGLVRSVKVVKM